MSGPVIEESGYELGADQNDRGRWIQHRPSHDASREFNMAASMSFAKRLQCSFFKISLGNPGLPFTQTLSLVGNSQLLFSRCLCYASRNLYPEDQGRKIMVAGLREGKHETDREILERYFKSFGHIERVKLVRDQLTGRSRGYGFVTFKSSNVVDKILSAANHVIDGKGVRVSLAVKTVSRPGDISGVKHVYSGEKEERKIFVSGLKTGVHCTTDNDLKEYFSAFGEVEEVKIVASKSYGFVTFKTPESVTEVLSKGLHSIAGWKINVELPFRGDEKTEITRKAKRAVNVYNVSSATSDEELVSHLLAFGEVEKVLGRDSDKHSSQCMVVFKTESAAKMAMEQQVHEIATGGTIYVKPISWKSASKTILLRGTSSDITLEALQLYFEQFGQITCMDLTSDHHRPTHVNIHGVMFRTRPDLPMIEFQDERTMEKVLQHIHVICGKEVEIRKVDGRAMNSGAYSKESDRSMMVLIDHLPRNVSKKTVVDYFTSLSLTVQSIEFKMEQAQTMSCVVGLWNLDDVDQVIDQVAPNGSIINIDGTTVLVRRLHWESTQEEVEHDLHVNTENSSQCKE